MTHRFCPTILREYDIRGVVGKQLNTLDAYALGRSFGTMVYRKGGSRVAVGYDGRLSSPSLEAALVKGLCSSGIHVVRIGLGPTPLLYFAEHILGVDGGIEITGSHNPADQNGFKLVYKHAPFFGSDLLTLAEMAANGDWTDELGSSEQVDLLDRYVARLMQDFDGRAFKIGWDAGNGATGPVIEKLIEHLPGEHHILFTKVDGHFPNHHPDPTEDKNLCDLIHLVREKHLDFGVAFDGDGDRIGVVDSDGEVIWGDQLLSIFAQSVLKNHPGATIIADIKSTQSLFDRIAILGGKPVMARTGHSHIKSDMVTLASPLGGEMTGHICFADDYYGFDDGLYAAIRLIRASTSLGQSVTELRAALPKMANTPDIRIAVDESRKFSIVEEVRDRVKARGENVEHIDGVRVRLKQGWWLLRPSNTQAAITARAESYDSADLPYVIEKIEAELRESGIDSSSEWVKFKHP